MKNPFRRNVGRRLVVGALAALLPLTFAMPAEASDSIDQSVVMTFWHGFQWNVPFMAQTFTAKVGGQVDRVSLPLSTPTGFGLFTVSLYNVNAATGQPSDLIRSAPFTSGFVPCCPLYDYSFSPAVPVSGGTKYAIVVQLLAGNVKWLDSGTAVPYSGGQEWIGADGTSWLPTTHGDFGFEEWVANNVVVNQPPAVTADKSVISYSEGTSLAATNSGSCSDPDGDPVTLTASAGSVSACTGGRWSWSLPTPDELAQETVTITASDGSLTKTATFTVAVDPVDPTAQILGDPPSITVPEMSNLPFTGTATSPDAADNASQFTYAWTVAADNGTAYAPGSGSSFSFVPKDDGTYLVTFSAKDDGGMIGSTSMVVVATNVAPNAKIDGIGPVQLVTTTLETLNFNGSFTDVDAGDKYTITWDFGDNSGATGLTAQHHYNAPGTYTVKFQVNDGEGGVGQATASVTVQTTQQALGTIESFVQSLSGLNSGQKNSLTAKLSNAADAAARGDNNAAANELDAFLNELQAYVSSGKVTASQAATLRNAVNAVRGSLGSFNRLVDWWPLEA